MKPFAFALRPGVLALAALLGLTSVSAQQDELVTVYFQATCFAPPFNPTTLLASITESKTVADPSVPARTRVSSVGPLIGNVVTAWKDLRVEVGRVYTVTITATPGSAGHNFAMKTPPGYHWEGTGPYSPGAHKFRVMPDNIGSVARRAGEAESFGTGHTSWGVSLGALGNGSSAGSIRLIDVGFEIYYWTGIYSPTGLKILSRLPVYNTPGGASAPFVVGAPRQMKSPEALVDIVPVSATEYELRFYDASLFSETAYPYDVTGKSPYVVYNVQKPSSSSTEVQITRKTYGASGYPSTPLRTEVTTLTRSGDWPDYIWTVNDWNKSGDSQLVQAVDTWDGVSGSDYTSSVVVRHPGTSAVAAESLRTLGKYAWGEAPVSSRTGPSGDNLTTSYEYYTDDTDHDSYSRVKTVTYPSDAWEGYEYYGLGENDMADGGFRVHRPYLNSPASVPSNLTTNTAGEISTYWFAYRAPSDKRPLRLEKVERTIGGTLAAKTEFGYYSTGDYATYGANTRALVRATRYDWTEDDPDTRLKTVTRYYDSTNDGLAGDQILSIERPDKTKTAFGYHTGNWSGTAFTADDWGTEEEVGTATRVTVVHGTTDTSGTQAAPDLNEYAFTSSNDTETDVFRLVTGRSTMESTVRNSRAQVVQRQTRVWDGDSWELLSTETSTYNAAGFVTERIGGNGAHYEATYDGELKTSETDATGVVTSFTSYDSTGRLLAASRAGAGGSPDPVPAVVTAYAYDAAGRLTSQTTGSSEQIVSSRTFDTAGRVTAESAPGPSGAVTTSYAFASLSPGYRRTATLPNSQTRIETHHPDGKLASLTGTGVIHRHFDYGLDGGQYKTTVYAGSSGNSRKVETWTDWLGRTVKTSRPGYSVTSQAASVGQSYYDGTTGQLLRTTLTGYADTVYEYDIMGRVKRSGLDVSASSTLTDNSLDRITESDVVIEAFDSAWWLRETTSTFFTDSSATKTRVATARTRLSGFSGNVQAESRFWDAEDADSSTSVQTSKTVVEVDRSAKTVTETTTRAGISTTAVRTIKNGAVISERGHDNLTATFAYDALARLIKSTDPRTGETVTAYKSGTALPYTVTSPASTVVTYGYDSLGRLTSVKNPDNKHAYTGYDDLGRAYRQWGDAATPVETGYDSTYGDPTTLTTYRGGTGWTGSTWPGSPGTADTTISAYDAPSGLLISKTDATTTAAVTYEYDAQRRVTKRTWARGVYAEYAYTGNAGELTGITYSDSTPDVSYTYTRAGQMLTAGNTDTGAHTFAYDSSKPWRLDYELLPSYLGDRWLSPLYEASGMVGRATGFQLGTSGDRDADLHQEWQFEGETGRFLKVLSSHSGGNTRTFTYGYTDDSNLIGSLRIINPGGGDSPFTVDRTYETNRDLVTQVQTNWSGSAVAQFDYAYTSRGQRDWEKRGGTDFLLDGLKVTVDYQYDGRGQLTGAPAYRGETMTAPNLLPNLQPAYEYDNAGNRTSANQTGDVARKDTFTPNALNQLAARDNKSVIASGTVGSAAAVALTVNGGAPVAADRQGSYWSKAVTPANASTPDTADLAIYAGQGSSTVRSEARTALVGPAAQTLQYDADGNLTRDGTDDAHALWTYDYDAENRLIRMTAASGAVTAGAPNRKIEFQYDYAGRRVQKVVSDWNGSGWTVSSGRRFIYSGWHLIAELLLNPSTSTYDLNSSYTWGLDIAGSLSATGGVGALLQITQHAGTAASYLPAHDANGNVMALYDAGSGTAAAIYEYSPFGELLRAEGAYAKTNPFRFSSKFTDDETGLVYYGHRYYSPGLGRFINRDPIGEAGGLNLYAFVGNDPANDIDVLGLNGYGTEADNVGWGSILFPSWHGSFGMKDWETFLAIVRRDAALRHASAQSRAQIQMVAAQGLELDRRLVYRPFAIELNAHRPTGSTAGAPDSELTPARRAYLEKEFAKYIRYINDPTDTSIVFDSDADAHVAGALRAAVLGGEYIGNPFFSTDSKGFRPRGHLDAYTDYEYVWGIVRTAEGYRPTAPITNKARAEVVPSSNREIESARADGTLVGLGHNHPNPNLIESLLSNIKTSVKDEMSGYGHGGGTDIGGDRRIAKIYGVPNFMTHQGVHKKGLATPGSDGRVDSKLQGADFLDLIRMLRDRKKGENK